eukprot:Protomagalhaensia_wolfi_Nauph_80__4018@NODE_407_length_2582_cov_64_355879_g305_i0_p2_GENE_NODE_407_length_2582_cov_64_355879_g305_i0NODE_407_length_2582_cov_64_355879_g305_i0_p2_ORF_typecomplete_len257_score27_30ER_lumen_recept/PF00810_18/1_5e11DUF2921/PF11145_8/0_0038AA_permease/PF00324_21/0_0093PQloop/PF04193_14/0_54PQloop/PF04193_14/4_6PQloop/PF04193_14/4_6e03DUF5596/PF18082_1/12DUF5596/PF18082_1/9_7e03DUF5596/PF18082_1/84DUF5596/PF18082_1/1_2e04PGG/PF13962_6/0_28PGG/PF13962_6/2_2e03MARVEL/PF
MKELAVAHEALPVVATLLWLIAYAALLQKLRRERSAQGVSLQSLGALVAGESLTAITFLALLITPFSSSVSSTLLLCQGAHCALVFITFALAAKRFAASYQASEDDFGTLPFWKGGQPLRGVFRPHWIVLYLLAFGGACVIESLRPNHGLPVWLSALESFAGMIVALALLPQIRMFYKAGRRRIVPSLGRFIIAMLLARLTSLLYWLTERVFHDDDVMPGRGTRLIGESINIAVLTDFTWTLYKAARQEKQSVLPL